MRHLLALVAMVHVAACVDDNDPSVEIDPVVDTIGEGEMRGTALAQQSREELDGNAFDVTLGMTASILAALNDSRVQEAVFATNVVFADDTFDLAEELLDDHVEANVKLDNVVRSYGIPYLPSATADGVIADSNAELSILRATDPGNADFVYTQGQVVRLTETLVLLDQLAVSVGPGAMADHIAATHAMIEPNLDEAIDLLEDFY